MGKINKNTIEVMEKVYINQKTKGGNYYCYYRYKGQKFDFSTKTSNRTQARNVAIEAYHQTEIDFQENLLRCTDNFETLAKKYCKAIEHEKKHTFHSQTLARHFVPYFKKFKINKINRTVIDGYMTYRRKKNPQAKNQTLNKEISVFNQMMDYLVDCEILEKANKIKRLKEKRGKRPYFNDSELPILLNTSKKRITETQPYKQKGQMKGLTTCKRWNRQLLHEIILILLNTGMRVDEIKTVRWKDINWEDEKIKLNDGGKTKGRDTASRAVIVCAKGMVALKRLYKRRLEYANSKGEKFSQLERIQSLPNGTFVQSMKKGFSTLIKVCDFEYDDEEIKHTLTSCRHTYATYKLTGRLGATADVRALSKQMGTNQVNIERNYAHDTVEDYEDKLR